MKVTHLNRNHHLAFLLDKVVCLPVADFEIFIKRLELLKGIKFNNLNKPQQLLFLKCLELNELQCSDVIDYINNLQGGN